MAFKIEIEVFEDNGPINQCTCLGGGIAGGGAGQAE